MEDGERWREWCTAHPLESLRGTAPNLTRGLSTKDYLDAIRGPGDLPHRDGRDG